MSAIICAGALGTMLLPPPALAQTVLDFQKGGDGGFSSQVPVPGGTLGQPGTNGANGGTGAGGQGGGGGGAGASGGTGGSGVNGNPPTTPPGQDGTSGTAPLSNASGGGGGNGGSNGQTATSPISNTSVLTGGAGLKGGNGGDLGTVSTDNAQGAGGGGGGEGGYGLIINGGTGQSSNTSSIAGGDGGAGGTGGAGRGVQQTGGHGGGGAGGVGVWFQPVAVGATFVNNGGTISGGTGGQAGFGPASFLPNAGLRPEGAGGIAFYGILTTNSGTIQGGNAGGATGLGVAVGNAGVAGAAGGGAGAYLLNTATGLTNTGTIAGGNGARLAGFGLGGNVTFSGGGGGVGIIATGGAPITNSGTIQGGNGGASTIADPGIAYGGAGGAGISASNTTITNSNGATVQGGTGGDAFFTANFAGKGGDGINGANLLVINSAAINGAVGGAGTSGAIGGSAGNAITFTAGTNRLELQAGYSFLYNVDGTQAVTAGGTNTLTLGGGANASFDTSFLGSNINFPVGTTNYLGFTAFQMTGSGTWTLTGTPVQASTPWTIYNGILTMASASPLGAGGLTFDTQGGGATGTLQITGPAPTTYASNVTLAANGTIDLAAGADLTLSQVVSGPGMLTQTGSGVLHLSGSNTFSGGLTVSGGTAQAMGPGNSSFGTGVLTVASPGIADLNNFDTTTGGLQGNGSVTLGTATLTLDQSIATLYSGVISGTGGLTMNGTGELHLTGNSTYSGATNINSGVVWLDGSIGAAPGGPTATIIAGAGTLGGTGTVFGDVSNSGLIQPGYKRADPGSQFTINGNYTGNGGNLALKTYLGTDSSPTDQLIIAGAGNNASGSTNIGVTNVNGPGAMTTGNGIPVIVATGGANTDAGAFQLSGNVAKGPFQYLLFRGGTGDADSWFLRSHCIGDCNAPPPTCTGPDCPPPPPPTPIYRPDVSIHSVLASMARQQELATLGTFHERNGDQRLATGAGNRTAGWGRVFGQLMEQSHSGTVSAHLDGEMGGLQAGIDALQWVSQSGHQDRFGLFAAYARTTGDVRGHALGTPNRIAGRAELGGTSFGGYWTHLAPTGWYTDTVVMGTRFNGGGNTVVGTELDVKGYGVTASVEGGYPITIAPGVRLEPQGQLVYSHLNIDDVHDPHSYVAYDTPDALFGRLGLRLSADMLPLPMVLRPYLKANLWQDFTENDTIRFEHVHQIASRHRATTLELGGGIVWQVSSSSGLWFDAGYTTDIGGSDDQREAVHGTAGLRVTW